MSDIGFYKRLAEQRKKVAIELYDEMATLKQQRDDLLADLKKYGECQPGCIRGDACNCGFKAAVAKYET